MAILGCNFNINFGQTLAPGSSLCNTLRTKLHAWTESSIIVEFMVKFIWQHNLPVGLFWHFQTASLKAGFLVLNGQKMRPPVTPKLKVREGSQSGFWSISSHPTSVPSFSQIGWPQLLVPGTLSQTITHKHAPLRALSMRESKQLAKPWITKGLREATKLKNELFYSGGRERYKLYRNKRYCYFLELVKEIIIIPILN